MHHGRVPQWLASRMAALGRGIVEAIVLEYGPGEVLTRLSDPFWFQALGCVMGMDWHSSGIVAFLREHPDRQLRELRRLVMARPHEIAPSHVDEKRLGAVLKLAYERQHTDFTDALLLKGVGPRTLQSLALVSEVIHGAPSRFSDPARFSFAHGGKDGSPFPVPLKVYDESIGVLKRAVEKARIDHSDRVRGLRTLSDLSRTLEKNSHAVDVEWLKREERRKAPLYGGRTVLDGPKGGRRKRKAVGEEGEQLSLF